MMHASKVVKFWWLAAAVSFVLIGGAVWFVMLGNDEKGMAEHNDIERNDIEHNDIEHNDIERNEVAPHKPSPVEDGLEYLKRSLRELASYDEAKVQSIEIQNRSNSNNNMKPYTVPKHKEHVILQSLYWIDLSIAEASDQSEPNDAHNAIVVTIHSTDQTVAVPYHLEQNTYKLGDTMYYASEEVARLMHGLFKSESELAKIDAMSSKASAATDTMSIDEGFRYEYERFAINDMDFHGWKQLVANDSATTDVAYYYDSGLEALATIQYYNDQAVVLEREIFFISDEVKTKDGIRLGITKQEVTDLLGKPNAELESRWSYLIGDYLKFHLYFEQDAVVYMSLTLPL